MNKLFFYMFWAIVPFISFGQDLNYKTLENVYYYDSNSADQTDYMKEKSRLDIYYPEVDNQVPGRVQTFPKCKGRDLYCGCCGSDSMGL